MPRGVKGSAAPHGTTSRYNNQGCRCDECREANRVYGLAYARKRGAVPEAEYRESVKRHGITAYRRRGCRCEVCRAALAAQKRRQRANNPEYAARENKARAARRRRTGK